MKNITESDSTYQDLEKMDTLQLLEHINAEDKTVAYQVEKVITSVRALVDQIVSRMEEGGRLFYIGAGTSGRLGIVDASECPPTFGTDPSLVTALMAGGDVALRKSVEFAEDDPNQGWKDLNAYQISKKDVLIGIAASGKTPYVVGALRRAQSEHVLTGCITCNEGSPLAEVADYPIEVVVGSEFLTGSTRMKAGTAQKLVLNMISTTVMIKRGRVQGNKMVDMDLSNQKLVRRGIKIIVEATGGSPKEAKRNLEKYGSVRKAIENFR